MATQFTINQQRAVQETGHNILVAASAGSGKTTVLIERLIQKILAGTSVENFLIVTFTHAAANEMRERLEIAIEKRLQTADEHLKRFLQEQLLLLPAANISTIDAYALRLIENYYHVIGLDPQFRLLSDTAERDMLRQDVLNDVFSEFYEETHVQHVNFLALVTNFGDPSHDDQLQNIVLKLADFAEARPDGSAWLQSLREDDLTHASDLTQSHMYRHEIRPIVENTINQLLAAAKDIQILTDGIPEFKKTQAGFLDMITYLNSIESCLVEGKWDVIRDQIMQSPKISIETKASKGVKEEPEMLAILSQATTVKNKIIGSKSDIKNLADTFFRFNEKNWLSIQYDANQLTQTLMLLTQTFREAFAKAKRTAKLVDFPDLGALALQILADDATQKTVSGQFSEILVDEYQDINQLQETLLSQVSNGQNMYMVGDVKQSIYGFRQAEPSLFTQKYKRFAQASNDDSRIELADNFRSQNNVTQVTNLIFTQLMDEKLGDIAYLGEARLVPKAAYPVDVPAVFDVDIITTTASESNQDETSDDDPAFEKRQAQYARLADKILKLRQTTIYDRKNNPAGMRPVEYADIAILTRSKAGYIDLVATLRQAGIPVQVDSVGNYFQTMEIYLMLDVLRVVDNPHQDVPLVAVLRSPMFNLTENDLAAIRLTDQKHDFWTALQEFSKNDARGKVIRDSFQKWHLLATQNDLVTLIWTIFDDTAWLDYVAGMPGGAQRQANLHALYDYARTYQTNNNAGLFRFVRYIEQLQDNDGQLGEAPQEADVQAVRIMTIHASKGLEFPIVFLPEFDKAFNTKDLTGKVLIQKDAGIGMDYMQPDALVSMPTLQKLTVQQALKRQSWSEEMRLLYVALTRAEQQLYIIGSVKVDDDGQSARLTELWQRAKKTSGQFLAEDLRLSAKSYLDWLVISLARTKNQTLESWLGDGELPRLVGSETLLDGQITINLINDTQIKSVVYDTDSAKTDQPENASYSINDFAQAKKIMTYDYSNQNASYTAAYQSVSEMKRLFEDPDRPDLQTVDVLETGDFKAANVLVNQSLALPEFMTDGSKKPSSAAVGVGTHLILQLVDFKAVQTQQTLEKLRDELVASHRILPQVAALINIDSLIHFLETSFAQQLIRHVDTLRREATFAMIIPANQIYRNLTDDEPILVHGIIDGYFIDELTKVITIFDYKTDFVRHNRIEEDLQKIIARYKGQLRLYEQALRQEYPEYTFNTPQLVVLSIGRVIGIDTRI
ncbi:helicase-exonuclease AddAB subunit AddA [Leuconostoc rapi]|uniref:helicase-exonuclease AddAB subunit AddA n=1 Tax=Leuconostoc rapi TaxID=1406906 RepID=UPI00195AADA0|nr:helicase-exonuclease AddAB subunit AddA [Leuconostoc rapi]MBM7435591.1 ATP-dependent helicase/nuclease subunit A [Leuconostoc rapi]